MNKKLLIVSATAGNNLKLSNDIKKITNSFKLDTKILNVEELNLPLYTPNEQKKNNLKSMDLITQKFINANGFIFCAPEYNGSIPPVLTNLFAWISVSTNHWRDVFINKKAIIATHSGGGGNNLIQSMRIQLCHLGIVVLPRTIIVNKYSKFVEESTKEKIQQLYDLF